MVSAYLSFWKTETESGQDFYFFRGIVLPGDFSGPLPVNLIKIQTAVQYIHLYTLPTDIPNVILSGTSVYQVDGTPWTAPDDLYKAFVMDWPVSFKNPANHVTWNDLVGKTPYVVYTEVAPSPSLIPYISSLGLSLPDIGGNTCYSPLPNDSEWSEYEVTVCSRHNDYPFWTFARPQFWWAYNGCEYDPDATPPYNSHITFHGSQLYIDSFDSDGILLRLDGYAYKITSCNDSDGSINLHYEFGGGSIYYLAADLIVPSNPV